MRATTAPPKKQAAGKAAMRQHERSTITPFSALQTRLQDSDASPSSQQVAQDAVLSFTRFLERLSSQDGEAFPTPESSQRPAEAEVRARKPPEFRQRISSSFASARDSLQRKPNRVSLRSHGGFNVRQGLGLSNRTTYLPSAMDKMDVLPAADESSRTELQECFISAATKIYEKTVRAMAQVHDEKSREFSQHMNELFKFDAAETSRDANTDFPISKTQLALDIVDPDTGAKSTQKVMVGDAVEAARARAQQLARELEGDFQELDRLEKEFRAAERDLYDAGAEDESDLERALDTKLSNLQGQRDKLERDAFKEVKESENAFERQWDKFMKSIMSLQQEDDDELQW